MDPFDVTTIPSLPLNLLVARIIVVAAMIFFLYHACRALADCWRECRHGPEDTDYIDIPPEWGLDVAVWCVCRRCGNRTVITRARMRQLDLE